MSSVEVQIDRAAARYQEAQSVGKCGGRPRLEIDRDKAYRLYGELKNWEKVAKVMGVSARTLKDRRVMWELEGNGQVEKRGFFQNINFLEKTRLEKNIFFWKKLNPFFHSFFKKKHLFLFFFVRPGAESEKTPMYMYMYIFIYIGFRLSIVLRTKKRQNHRVPSLYEGPRPGFWEFFPKKKSGKNFKT